MEKKCIMIGVTGGIAVYKICSLVSSLKKKGHEVHVLMTKEAEEFVSALTFQTLSGQRVIRDMFSVDFQPDVHHISLAKKAECFVLAPATANIIAKVSHGIADDMLTTTFLAADCPKIIVPAMNTGMLENPITQDNIETCRKYGMHILESASGYLACGDTGKGRLPEPDVILDKIESVIEQDRWLKGKKILVTAGPTRSGQVSYKSFKRKDGIRSCQSSAQSRGGSHTCIRPDKSRRTGRYGICICLQRCGYGRSCPFPQ